MKRLLKGSECLLAAVAAALFAVGCSPAHMAKPSDNGDRLAALVDLEDETQYVATQKCLSRLAYQSVEVLNEQHLLFEDFDEVWVNRLRARCPQLNRHDTMIFEMHSSRLCELDTVSPADRMMFWWRKAPPCTLGDFKKLAPAAAQRVTEAY
ncbi:MAG: DUF6491 family protein [Xanthomonadales bacterium]|nr:DUF6491 family protein [Xanthomonadales bacterium]